MRVIGILLLLCITCAAQLPRRVVQDMKRATSQSSTPDYGVNAGLVNYWKLDETSGTNAADAMGHNTLVLSGVGWTNGVISGGLDESVAASTLYNPTALTDRTNMSVTGWVWSTNTSAYLWFVDAASAIGHTWYAYGDKGNTKFTLNTGDPSFSSIAGTGNVFDGAWHFVAITTSNKVLRLYVDGSIVTGTLTALDYQGTEMWIGRYNALTGKGRIDDVRLYNRPLTDAEVSAQYIWRP